jgi:hypothetical protein
LKGIRFEMEAGFDRVFRLRSLTCGNGLEKLPVLYAVQKQCQKKNEPGQPARP